MFRILDTFYIILMCAALFAGGTWAIETFPSGAAELSPGGEFAPRTSTLTLLSTAPIVFSWDGRETATALAMDNAIVYTPNDRTIYVSGEAAHLKYIVGRVDSSAAATPSTIFVYKVPNGKTPCQAGTLMMATGKSFDASQAAGAIETIALGADTLIPVGSALCVAAVGDFSTAAGTITIGIGP
jgi:hypothetical protein